MDQIASFDLPDAVDYILKVTGVPSLSYIGFSQGSAQGFAGLSLNSELNKKINLFIALAPATKPKGLENQTIHSFVNASPELIFLLFGRKALLSSCLFWQNVITPHTFSWFIGLLSNADNIFFNKRERFWHGDIFTSKKWIGLNYN
jgi:lysosomal acid lipase/cholesteryl ester hydrolase